MTIWIEILVGLAFVALFVALTIVIAINETKRLHSYREWSDKFFNLSSKMLDYDLPAEWISLIDSLNNAITSKTAAYGLYRSYLEMAKVTPKKNSDPLPADEIKFMEANPEAADIFVAMARAGFLAITFSSPLGTSVRSLMAEAWVRRENSSTAVREVEKARKTFVPRIVSAAA
jgi:hypothetical protein